MGPPGDESPKVDAAVVLYRLAAVEESLRDLRNEFRQGLASLAFVSREVYQSERQAQNDYAKETREIATQARVIALATVSLVIAGFGALLALVKAVAK